MSTSSQHLNLTVPDESDPFLRTDFVNNYNKLDQYPGRYICTSTTRPAWGTAQTGMWIVQTDTRSELQWSGTSWNEPQAIPPAWYTSISPSAQFAGIQTITYTLATVNVRRPGSIVALFTMNGKCMNPYAHAAALNLFPLIDNAYVGNYPVNGDGYTSGGPDYSQWPLITADPELWNDYRVIPTMGMKSVGVGTHTIGLHVQTGPDANGLTAVNNIRMIAFLVNSSDV